MKEQVSVEEIKYLQMAIDDNLCSQCVITFDELLSEHQRLKQMEEVVKLYLVDVNKGNSGLSRLVDFIDKLESLDK